jgi:hypothetical protein
MVKSKGVLSMEGFTNSRYIAAGLDYLPVFT